MTGPAGSHPVAAAVRDGSIEYSGLTVLDHVDIDIEAGAELVISGRSGSGKTSLLLVLAGLITPSRGTVAWPGLDPDPVRRRRQIAMVFQAPSLIPELSASENVCLPLRLSGGTIEASTRAASDALEHVGLDAAHGRVLPSEMSGGEQQRVSVARAMAMNPRLLLADEPTGALDRANAVAVIAALQQSARENGSSLVVATHDEEVAEAFSEHLVVEDRFVRWVLPSPA
jgi:ABC-type lipoprotein export system ATPase subunit